MYGPNKPKQYLFQAGKVRQVKSLIVKLRIKLSADL